MSEPQNNVPKTRIALAYIGDEQLAWGRQAFGRQKHYYIMPGILQLAGALKQRADELGFEDSHLCYFNRSAQDLETMVDAVVKSAPAVVGISSYSWNLNQSLKLARKIKKTAPDTSIVLGGPGVSFSDAKGSLELLARSSYIDAVVRGEGEPVVADLFSVLARKSKPKEINGTAYRLDGEIHLSSSNITPVLLEELPPVDYTNIEIQKTPNCGLAAVFETYRGCPYRCAYCGFGGGKRGIRRFPLERTMESLDRIFKAEIDLVHFADSVFDMNLDRAKSILSHCLKNNRETALFCYASLQNIDDELVALYEKSRIQIGVGLQSWSEEVLKRIERRFSVGRFERNVAAISKREVNYYVDIMFGLPGDDMSGFRKTVNRVMGLAPPFIMLFPLTLIPGTPMAADPDRWGLRLLSGEEIGRRVKPVSGMVYADIALFNSFGLGELQRFDDVATALFFSYQRFPLTFKALNGLIWKQGGSKEQLDAFEALEKVGAAIARRLGREPVDVANPPNVEGTVRETLTYIARELGCGDEEVRGLESLMRVEAGVAALLSRSDRPSLFAKHEKRTSIGISSDEALPRSSKVAFNGPARLIETPHRFASLLPPKTVKTLGRVEKGFAGIALAPWDHFLVSLFEIGAVEREICRELEPDREIQLVTLERRMKRVKNAKQWEGALESLERAGIVAIFE